MMKRIIIFCILIVSLVYGIEYSLRIKALGEDFAYLVPDYETDLYLDPNLLGEKKISGITWHHGETPLVMRVVGKRFAWSGKYWGKYYYTKYSSQPEYRVEADVDVKDFWMWDLRGKLWKFLTDDVWNFYNDGSYDYYHYYESDNNYNKAIIIKLFPGVSGVTKLNSYFKICSKMHSGVYYYDYSYKYYGSETQYEYYYIPVSMRVGLHYRNIHSNTSFTSFYLMVGGPTSTEELDGLPFSVWTGMGDEEKRLSCFARTLITRAGFARGVSILKSGMLVFGISNAFLTQYAEEFDSLVTDQMRAFDNTLTFPVGVEYNIDKLTVRFGCYLRYSYNDYRTWDYFYPDSLLTRDYDHRLSLGRSFGLQWRLTDQFVIDLYNGSDISSVSSWKVYLKYEIE